MAADKKMIMDTPNNSLDAALADVLTWVRRQFPHRTIETTTAHLLQEAIEVLIAPQDPGELADVLMLITSLADLQGINLAEAVRAKLAINTARTWAPPNPIGVSEHVREFEQ